MKEQNYSNPYLISFTAGGLLYDETISLQPYLNDEKIELIANEVKINKYLPRLPDIEGLFWEYSSYTSKNRKEGYHWRYSKCNYSDCGDKWSVQFYGDYLDFGGICNECNTKQGLLNRIHWINDRFESSYRFESDLKIIKVIYGKR